MDAVGSSLNAHVLVLNKLWMAVRVVDARRAFSLLVRDLAEVIRVDDGSYSGCNFETWTELSQLRDRYDSPMAAGGLLAEHDYVRTVSMRIAVPKIIRLYGYDRLPAQDVKLNRRNIFARDKNICQYCGERFNTSELSLDHIVPRSQGGGSSWVNLVCCCLACNARKGGRTPLQANMKLIRKPVKPRRNPAITVRMSTDKYACWQTFLDNAYWSVELK